MAKPVHPKHGYPPGFVSQIVGALPINPHRDCPLNIQHALRVNFPTAMHAMEALQWHFMRLSGHQCEIHVLSAERAVTETTLLVNAYDRLPVQMWNDICHSVWVPHVQKQTYSHISQRPTPWHHWERIVEERNDLSMELLTKLFLILLRSSVDIDVSKFVQDEFMFLCRNHRAMSIIIDNVPNLKLTRALCSEVKRETNCQGICISKTYSHDSNCTLLYDLARSDKEIWNLIMDDKRPFANAFLAEERRHEMHGFCGSKGSSVHGSFSILENPLLRAIQFANTHSGVWLAEHLPAGRLCGVTVNAYGEHIPFLIAVLCRWRPCHYSSESTLDDTKDCDMKNNSESILLAILKRMPELELFRRVLKRQEGYRIVPEHTYSYGWNASDYLRLHPKGLECSRYLPQIAEAIHFYTELPTHLFNVKLNRLDVSIVIQFLNGCVPRSGEWETLNVIPVINNENEDENEDEAEGEDEEEDEEEEVKEIAGVKRPSDTDVSQMNEPPAKLLKVGADK